ncbi:MipA/OmpV family protein [Burkholderia sp. Ac-20365]|uniref:MipA/OmpV family protein n=1 Tax=Burkholderia sp. Ac-20365 TaxID=2703897 RepID=UPI00197C07BB|nr:MipA/OmpV family protein [Burkholderia sp. Ac-20365]MBN3763720.1 MipA/OmpV family protein [Burkholderia sp. Ac-20365]
MTKAVSFAGAKQAATVAAAFSLMIHAAGAMAEDAPAAQDSTATAQPASKWKIGVGPGLIITPQYPGSHELRYIPYPALDVSYDDRVFSQGPDVLGLNVIRSENYHVGAALSFDFQSRDEKDDPHLHGLGNVDGSPKLKVFADYTLWAFTGSVALYQDLAGHGQGKYITTDLYASLPAGGWLFSVGPGFTWADALYTRTFFGVSTKQSAASGLPAYNTGSGIRDVHLNGYVSYDISKHWAASVAVTLGRLQHYAAGSPITERRSELNTLASVNYRF